MSKSSFRTRPILFLVGSLVVVALPVVSASPAVAEPDVAAMREADKHFQQGVTFYGEADYPAALVEFNRAYGLAPNDVVLFNIGETQYQLRAYPAALATFERFLAQAQANDPHRAVAENNLKELRSRVGRLTIASVPPGAEITIGDRVIGRTPIESPIVVGVGQVIIKGTAPGRAPIVRTVEVAAEDEISLLLELPTLGTLKAAQSPGSDSANLVGSPSGNGSGWRTAGWVATGLLAGGALTFGLLARREANQLRAAKDVYPPDPPDGSMLDGLARRTNTYSIIADSLGAGAVVLGAITLISSLSAPAEGRATRVAIGPGSIALDLRF